MGFERKTAQNFGGRSARSGAHENPRLWSGGFTSYSDSKLREQLGGWAESGFLAMKMKIGRDAAADAGYDLWYFRRMLAAEAVDVLQADSTRCAGITGFLLADALCESHSMPLSAHTSPSIQAHACCGAQRAVTLNTSTNTRASKPWLSTAIQAEKGFLTPDLSLPGFGLVLKESDVQEYLVFESSK